jgi:hypothetical protein
MPEVIAEALVRLRPEVDEADTKRKIKTAVDRAERDIPPIDIPVDEAGLNSKLASIGRTLKGLIALEGLQRGAQLVGALADQASDLDEAVNAAGVTFRGSADDVVAWSETARSALGLSQSSAIEAAAAFGGMFDQLDLGDDITANLSKGLVQVAGDLASLRNLNVDDALVKIQSGLAGETEPLRRFGVDLSEVAVQAKAVELGLAEAGDVLTQQEKVIARAAIIMSDLSEAQGDSANTADGYAGAQRRLSASAQDLAAAVGGSVTPTLAEFAANLAFLADKATDLSDTFDNNVLGDLAGDVVKVMNPVLVLNDALNKLRERYGDAADGSEEYADATASLAEAVERLNELNLDTEETLAKRADAALDAADLDLARRQAALGVADAELRLTEVEDELAAAMRGGGKQAEEATRAAEKLEDAHRSLADAQEKVRRLTNDLSDAQEAYAEAVFHFGPGSREARDAARDLEEAQYDLGAAQDDATETAEDLAKAQEEAADAASKTSVVVDASRKLEKARLDLEGAVLRSVRAEEAFSIKSDEAKNKTVSEREQLERTRDAMQLYADKLEGPVKTAMQNRIAELDRFIAQLKEVESLASGATFGAEPPQIGAGDLGPGAIGSGGLAGGGGAVGGNALGGGAVGAGSLQRGITVNFNYPVPPEQTAAYVESISRVRR